jgi:hypothetical protein
MVTSSLCSGLSIVLKRALVFEVMEFISHAPSRGRWRNTAGDCAASIIGKRNSIFVWFDQFGAYCGSCILESLSHCPAQSLVELQRGVVLRELEDFSAYISNDS